MDRLTGASIAAGAVATGAYLNGKYQIAKDLGSILRLRTGQKNLEQAIKDGKASLFLPFEAICREFPARRAIWSRSGNYTFAQMYKKVCQYANYFLSLGVEPGDVVAVYLVNCPEFTFIWFGLWSIGCVPSTLNYNLAAEPLVHCVKICKAKVLMVDADDECQSRVKGCESQIHDNLGVKIVSLSTGLKTYLNSLDDTRPDDRYRASVSNDSNAPCLIIYTSGTTGLPKAFAFRNNRLYSMATMKRGLPAIPGPDGEVWYDPMPFYHGTGGLMAISCLISGSTLAIGRTFSVHRFWTDVRESKATLFVYVGETARYLLSQPPSPDDKKHHVQLMYGNGLRPDVWKRFQERFGIPQVFEFFASTEGMFGTFILCRSGYGAGSVGHHGLLMRRMLLNTYVPVRIDYETGDIWRSKKTGFAQREDYSTGGEIIVHLPSKEAWPGYWNADEASNQKVIRDVFKKGDMYFRPGDALRRTDDGLWYFLDRLGDTYRWKGENVSTTEVSEVLGKYPGVNEANVYGVEIPNHDGRVGCAAMTLSVADDHDFDWRGFAVHVRSHLPRYAIPVFIRLTTASMGSHNNKQDKVRLRAEGIDPSLQGTKVKVGQKDKVYWLKPKAHRYEPFSRSNWRELKEGRQRI